MLYYIYDRKIAIKHSLDKAFLRSVNSKRLANVYISDNPSAYIVKTVPYEKVRRKVAAVQKRSRWNKPIDL